MNSFRKMVAFIKFIQNCKSIPYKEDVNFRKKMYEIVLNIDYLNLKLDVMQTLKC